MGVNKNPTPRWVIKLRKYIPLIIVGGILVALYFGGLLVQLTGSLTGEAVHFGIIHCIIANFTKGFYGFLCIALLYSVGAIWVILRYKDKHSRDLSKDERGFDLEGSGTYGTARFLAVEEARNFVEVEPLRKTKGLIIGKFPSGGKDGDDIVSVPPDGKRFVYDSMGKEVFVKDEAGNKVQQREKLPFNGNRHTMVIGPPGSGKSFCYSLTNIIQSIRQGESLVITDPKGELYSKTAEFARENNYCVRVLNLAWPAYSDSLDFLGEVRGEQLGIEAQVFANIVIENTVDPTSHGDEAYTAGEKNLFTALVLFVLTAPNCPFKKTLGGVYDLLCKNLKDIDAYFDLLQATDPNNPALAPWSIFKDGSEAFRGNLRSGLGNRLLLLNDEIIKNVTGVPEIDLTLPGKAKCAYYVIMSDMNTTFKFLSSLFFTYLFNRLVEYSRMQPSQRVDVPVNVIMDEFVAIGRLPDFDKKLATVRSAGINLSIIFQNLPQLQAMYPDGLWETIAGNCSTMVVLASNDITTAKYISDRSGTATVALEQTRVDRPVLGLGNVPTSMAHSYSVGKRAVLNPDEVLTLEPEKVIISITGAYLFKAYKVPYTDTIDPDSLKLVNIFDHVPAWREQVDFKASEESAEKTSKPKEYDPSTTKPKKYGPGQTDDGAGTNEDEKQVESEPVPPMEQERQATQETTDEEDELFDPDLPKEEPSEEKKEKPLSQKELQTLADAESADVLSSF